MELLTVQEAAREVDRSVPLIHHYIRQKRGTPDALPATKVATEVGMGKYYIRRDDFERWRKRVFEKRRRR